MDMFSRYRLEKVKNGYIVVLYMNNNSTEFSDELGHLKEEKNTELSSLSAAYIASKFAHIKVLAVKVVLGSIQIAQIPLGEKSVRAIELGV